MTNSLIEPIQLPTESQCPSLHRIFMCSLISLGRMFSQQIYWLVPHRIVKGRLCWMICFCGDVLGSSKNGFIPVAWSNVPVNFAVVESRLCAWMGQIYGRAKSSFPSTGLTLTAHEVLFCVRDERLIQLSRRSTCWSWGFHHFMTFDNRPAGSHFTHS